MDNFWSWFHLGLSILHAIISACFLNCEGESRNMASFIKHFEMCWWQVLYRSDLFFKHNLWSQWLLSLSAYPDSLRLRTEALMLCLCITSHRLYKFSISSFQKPTNLVSCAMLITSPSQKHSKLVRIQNTRASCASLGFHLQKNPFSTVRLWHLLLVTWKTTVLLD